MIYNLIIEQNKQLIEIVAEENNLDFKELAEKYIPSRQDFHNWLEATQN